MSEWIIRATLPATYGRAAYFYYSFDENKQEFNFTSEQAEAFIFISLESATRVSKTLDVPADAILDVVPLIYSE